MSGEMYQLQQSGTPMKQIPEELLDQLLEGYEKPEDMLGKDSLQKSVLERALEAEMTHHLGLCPARGGRAGQRQQDRIDRHQ